MLWSVDLWVAGVLGGLWAFRIASRAPLKDLIPFKVMLRSASIRVCGLNECFRGASRFVVSSSGMYL